jgi:hypothetical protein
LPLRKRTLVIIIASVVFVGLGVGGYYFFTAHKNQQEKQVAEQKKVIARERVRLDDTSFRGDRELASQYLERIQANDDDAAYNLYQQRIDKATDAGLKSALAEQGVVVASLAKQADHAIRFSVLRTQLNDGHRVSANAADVYAENNDIANQKKYLQQAIDRLELLPNDSQEYKDFKVYYQQMMDKIGNN